MSPYQSKKFTDLQTKWYGKLKDSGFKDLEQEDGNLKFWTSRYSISRNKINPGCIESGTEYYRLAGFFLHEHKFNSPQEKEIWRLHAEGVSIRNIYDLVDKPSARTTVMKINALLIRFTKKMLLDYCTPKEHNDKEVEE